MANAAGKYPVTCRTRKSSLRALMVLYGVRTGEQTAASLDYKRERKFIDWASSFLCICIAISFCGRDVGLQSENGVTISASSSTSATISFSTSEMTTGSNTIAAAFVPYSSTNQEIGKTTLGTLTYSPRLKAGDSGINKPCTPKSVLQVLLLWLMPQPFFYCNISFIL